MSGCISSLVIAIKPKARHTISRSGHVDVEYS